MTPVIVTVIVQRLSSNDQRIGVVESDQTHLAAQPEAGVSATRWRTASITARTSPPDHRRRPG